MRAMILAAGRGERLRPLTDTCPKPLIKVGGKALIEYHIENLQRAGITDIVINVAHLGEQIQNHLGNGRRWEVDIQYSVESPAKEVGGGIFQALPLLSTSPFIVMNGDVWSDYPVSKLISPWQGLAHLVMVDNPEHNPNGDFALLENQRLAPMPNELRKTYSGISVLHPELFAGCEIGASFRLRPLLDKAMQANQLTGEYYDGQWTDVGTVERLQALDTQLAAKRA